MPQHKQHNTAATLFTTKSVSSNPCREKSCWGGGARGLGGIGLCDCCQGYGIAKGAVDVCRHFAETFEGRNCYSDVGLVVAGVWIVISYGSCLFVGVVLVVWWRCWWWWWANLFGGQYEFCALRRFGGCTHPSILVVRSVPFCGIGTGPILSDCWCTACEIGVVLAGISPTASEVEGEVFGSSIFFLNVTYLICQSPSL